jgi:hypothetical protein
VSVTVYCDECELLVHLGHIPTVQTDDGLAFNLVPALRAHGAQH